MERRFVPARPLAPKIQRPMFPWLCLPLLLLLTVSSSAGSAPLPTIAYTASTVSFAFPASALPASGLFYHAFMDTDSTAGTGYLTQSGGPGAELMIEGEGGKSCNPSPIFYSYTGGATQGWSWQVNNIPVTCQAYPNNVTWTITRSAAVKPCSVAQAIFDYNDVLTSSVQLATQPGTCPLPSIAYTATNVSFTFQSSLLPTAGKFYHAFLDADSSAVTGYLTAGASLGADLMIESSGGKSCSPSPALYVFNGGAAQQQWAWKLSNGSVTCRATSSNVTWTVSKSAIAASSNSSSCSNARSVFEFNSIFTGVVALATSTVPCLPGIVYNSTLSVSFVFQTFTLPPPGKFYHAYFDTDSSSSTGFATAGGALGAELMIESYGGSNCTQVPIFYLYTGGTTQSWSWKPANVTVACRATATNLTWTVPLTSVLNLCAVTRAGFDFDSLFTSTVTLATQLGKCPTPSIVYNVTAVSFVFPSTALPAAGKLYHAFLDTDSTPATGYLLASGSFGADLMIESSAGNSCSPGAALYSYTGVGGTQQWTWKPTGKIVSCSATSSILTWTVLRTAIANPFIANTCAPTKAIFDYNSAFTNSLQLATLPASCPPTVLANATTISFIFQTSGMPAPGVLYHAFIDSDALRATGYLASKLGANLMVEASSGPTCSASALTLYNYTGGASQQWSWKASSSTKVTCQAGNGLVTWSLPRAGISAVPASANPCSASQVTFDFGGAYTGSVPIPRPSTYCNQTLLIPSYWPSNSPQWTRLWNLSALMLPSPYLIINPNNGDASPAEFASFQNVVTQSKAKGFKVLGYTYTGNGKRAPADVLSAVNRYLNLTGIDGIFLDECNVLDCGASLAYYQNISAYIRGKTRKVMMNPGLEIPECFLTVADAVMIFEDNAKVYSSGYYPAGYEASYTPSRFIHAIHTTASIPDMLAVLRLSKSRGAGFVYVTSDVLNATQLNPWDDLPTNDYLTAELNGLKMNVL